LRVIKVEERNEFAACFSAAGGRRVAVVLACLGYLILLWPVGCLVSTLTKPFRRQLSAEASRGLELAGFWIGCLERAFLMSFILFDYLGSAALFVGIKSQFRFGDIKDPANRKEAEYILIGTLMSLGLAMAVGILVRHLLRQRP
jgi:hypothetical protein